MEATISWSVLSLGPHNVYLACAFAPNLSILAYAVAVNVSTDNMAVAIGPFLDLCPFRQLRLLFGLL